MANEQQFKIIKSSAAAWNSWRQTNPHASIDLSGADLAGLDLTGVDLHEAELAGANFEGSKLCDANLTEAHLDGSSLMDADLRSAKLIRANLNRTNFTRARLREADLTHANIRDADFSGADVKGADLHRVHPSDRTIWPPLPLAAKVQYLYLLRVPILLGLTLFVLPIVSVTTLHSLLGNLFVLDLWNIFWTMIATVALAFSVMVVWRVVSLNGMERFGVQQALTRDVVSIRALLVSEALTLPMLIVAIWSNEQTPDARAVLARLGVALAGIMVAHMAGYLALLAAVLLSQRYRIPPEERFPLPFSWMKRLLRRAHDYNVVSNAGRAALGNWGKTRPLAFRAGYFDPHTGLLYPGHWLSFASLAATFVLYQLIGYLKHARLGQEFEVPAICYVVLLLLLLNWILGMAAFFLDRYRIPLLLLLVFLIWAGNQTPQSDHYYTTQTGHADPVRPERVLNAASRLSPDGSHPRGRVVVVATEGGGIQAAAWTAEVLTGLQRELHTVPANKPINFADSIALISSVSGGAVGTMFWVNGYQSGTGLDGFSVPDARLSEIVAAAEDPGLDEIAWAMAYPDFWRIFFPYTKAEKDRLTDRGLALEQNWSNRGNIHTTLNAWRQGVEQGSRPAVIFNSTFVETGEPFLLTTTDMPQNQSAGPQRKVFSELAPKSDIQAVTAVRLAATFPYVTPASRELRGHPAYHVVDGGYYDNYGVYSLLEWLRQALASTSAEIRPDVLIIQIRSFPSAESTEAKSRGWFYQTWAPVQTLLSVRTTAQLVRDRDALSHFLEQWSATSDKGARICVATFQFPGKDAPLSWRMNAAQIHSIEDEWDQQIHGDKNQEWLKIRSFFTGDQKCSGATEPQPKGKTRTSNTE